jgi:hypothetical protein
MSTGLGPTDMVVLFSTIFGDVSATRAARGLPPLVTAHLGKEWIRAEESPPRIVVVPTRTEYAPSRRMGAQPMAGKTAQVNPRVFFYGASTSMRTFGVMSHRVRRVLRPSRIFGTHSTARSNSNGNSLARSCATAATTQRSSCTVPSGGSRRTWIDLGACSFSASRSRRLSLTSRGQSSSTRNRLAAPGSSSLSTSVCLSRTAPRPIRASSSSREEV